MAVETFEADNLVIGNVVTDSRYVMTSGQNLARGRLLKLVSGKLTAANTLDTPHSVLLEDINATAGDTKCSYYVAGVLNENSINYGTGTASEFREKLRAVGIITKVGV